MILPKLEAFLLLLFIASASAAYTGKRVHSGDDENLRVKKPRNTSDTPLDCERLKYLVPSENALDGLNVGVLRDGAILREAMGEALQAASLAIQFCEWVPTYRLSLALLLIGFFDGVKVCIRKHGIQLPQMAIDRAVLADPFSAIAVVGLCPSRRIIEVMRTEDPMQYRNLLPLMVQGGCVIPTRDDVEFFLSDSSYTDFVAYCVLVLRVLPRQPMINMLATTNINLLIGLQLCPDQETMRTIINSKDKLLHFMQRCGYEPTHEQMNELEMEVEGEAGTI